MEGRTMGYLETALRRKAGLRWDLVMFSSPGGGGHYQERQSPLSASSAEEEALCAAADRSGLLWEDFSVDDLLDFGSGKEQYGGEEEGLFQVEEAEGNGEEGEERDGPSNSNTTSSSSSAMTFQAAPPSSDPIVPAGDVEDLEWVSRFVDDSYSEFTDAAVTPPLANPAVAKTEAPNAHGASRSSPSKRTWQSCYFSTESVVVVPAKARSKRSRCTAGRVWSLRPPPLLNEPPSSSCSSSSSSSSSSCSGSSSVTSCLLFAVEGDPDTILHYRCGSGPSLNPHQPPHLPPARKKKGRKPKALAEAAEQHPRRRCSHCGIEKTPQWRAGPMGAKTLCNACGVRYKSGRLLPEYRPAGSPTFISHVHSNSHRKVLEIRRCNDLSPAGCSPSPPQAAGVTRPHGVV